MLYFLKLCKRHLLAMVLVLLAPAMAHAAMEDYDMVQLQSLDKITARTMSFEAKVGSTVKFGSLYIKIQACRKAPPIEQPESAAFLQIWEIPPSGANIKEDEAQWIFSGWMFASSPALSSMDHPIYDVWVLDCIGNKLSDMENIEALPDLPNEPEGQEEKDPVSDDTAKSSPSTQE